MDEPNTILSKWMNQVVHDQQEFYYADIGLFLSIGYWT